MEAKRSANSPVVVGAKLRQAREARGLSIDDVAQALRLSARIVAALEDDAFDRLPGPTYARGYLRNYAQFLGVSPQPLVDAYNDLPQASQRAEISGLTPVHQVTSSDMLIRVGSVVVVVIVLGLAALWWSGHEGNREFSLTPASTPVPDTATDNGAEPTTPADVGVASTSAPAEDAAGTNEPVASAPTTSASHPPPVSTPPEIQSKPAPAPAVSAQEGASQQAAAAPATTSNLPTARLVLYVHEDSWADVRDGQQRRLLYETIPAGRVVTVEGVPPLSVFLGNVEGVTVEFNGQPYDAMQHKRGQVARFTLGSPQG